jgi:predicted AAA+ superfamily ATPase
MNPQEVEQYLIDFQKRNFPKLVDRTLKVSLGKKISAIVGPRRAGKTSYLYQIMREVMKAGKNKEDLIYLNFESTKLFDLDFKEIREVVGIHKRLFPKTKNPVLFLDEPQNVQNWEKAVRELDDEGYRIFVSGSSSKLLSKEIATSLRGRSISYLLLPFSFREFLDLKGFPAPRLTSSEEKTKILALLDEYLEFGGFPEVVLEQDKDTKLRVIESYLDLTVYKDIVERHGIKDSMLIKWLIKYVTSSYTKEMSINKIYNTLKSQGRRISKDELYSYASLLNDSLFALYLPKFSWSVRKREPVNRVFLSDTGFVKMIEIGKDRGKKMENVFYLEMLRRKNPITEYFFWKNVQHEEVDLIVKEGVKITQLIQISKELDNPETREREIRSLLKASSELKCYELIMITENHEAVEDVEWRGIKGQIKYIPLWKWLLTAD